MKHFDDLTKIDVPFVQLDDDTRNRLMKTPHRDYSLSKKGVIIYVIKPTLMTRQQVLERFNVVVTEEKITTAVEKPRNTAWIKI